MIIARLDFIPSIIQELNRLQWSRKDPGFTNESAELKFRRKSPIKTQANMSPDDIHKLGWYFVIQEQTPHTRVRNFTRTQSHPQ